MESLAVVAEDRCLEVLEDDPLDRLVVLPSDHSAIPVKRSPLDEVTHGPQVSHDRPTSLLRDVQTILRSELEVGVADQVLRLEALGVLSEQLVEGDDDH